MSSPQCGTDWMSTVRRIYGKGGFGVLRRVLDGSSGDDGRDELAHGWDVESVKEND